MKTIWSLMLVVAVLLIPLWGFAQQGAAKTAAAPEQKEMTGGEHGGAHHEMMHHGKDRKAKHEEMMAKMKEMDARLEQKVAAMNAATGDKKIEAMADVINELMAQRKEMHEGGKMMHHGMYGHKMMGGMAGKRGCPMMEMKQGAEAEPAAPAKGAAQ